jgi:hypothetical protein
MAVFMAFLLAKPAFCKTSASTNYEEASHEYMQSDLRLRRHTHICCGQEHAPIQQQADVAGAITAILVEECRSINDREEEVNVLKVASH